MKDFLFNFLRLKLSKYNENNSNLFTTASRQYKHMSYVVA